MRHVLLYPGHGTYQQGHGRQFYDDFRVVQDYFEEAQNCLGINFVKLCFGSSAQEFNEPAKNIVATFVYESAITALLQQKNYMPVHVIGLGSGIYAALHASKALSFPDALYLLRKLGEIYENFLKSSNWQALLIQSSDDALIEQICNQISLPDSWVKIALRARDWVVVAGHDLAVELLKDHLKDHNINCQSYDPSLCMMGLMGQEYKDTFLLHIHKVNCKDPQLSIADPSGKVDDAQHVRQALENLISKPQDWRLMFNVVNDVPIVPFDTDEMSQNLLTSIFGTMIILAQPQDLEQLSK